MIEQIAFTAPFAGCADERALSVFSIFLLQAFGAVRFLSHLVFCCVVDSGCACFGYTGLSSISD